MASPLISAHPQTASFGPKLRFRSFEILGIVHYACGFKITQALLRTKIYHLWTDTISAHPGKTVLILRSLLQQAGQLYDKIMRRGNKKGALIKRLLFLLVL